ncbi:MAG: DUF1549 domain-containing protein [Blastocatellia bacterium]
MPLPGTRRIKQLVVTMFIVMGLFAIFSMALQPDASVSAQRRTFQSQHATVSDCSFLKDPEEYRGARERHRLAVSQTTVAVRETMRSSSRGAAIQVEAQGLVAPQDIPRKNFVDNILFDRMAREGVGSAPLSSDAEFIRRVTIDLTGRIPDPDAVTQFLDDTNPAKRDLLVDRLMQSPEYIDKWAQFFGDLFKNAAFATNITNYRGGRDAFHEYIRDAIATNRSYAQIATDLITANGDSWDPTAAATNFIVGGNVPMGPAQDTMDGLAVRVSSTFLGINAMDCLLCHNGPGHLDAVNLWGSNRARAEAWGMSAFFARTARRFVQRGAPPTTNFGSYVVSENTTGEYQLNTNFGNRQTRAPINGKSTVDPKYMFGGGTVNTGENRRQALARLIIADPQFSRAIVNFIWENLMVEALVSPSSTFDPARLDPNAQLPDGWTLQPANAQLLEALATDFKQKGYDLKQLIGTIAKSSAYQLSSRYPGEWKLDYVPYYARKYSRRLSAEEIHDAIIKSTGLVPTMAFNGGANLPGYVMVDDNNVEKSRILWAMQLPEPAEPRSNGGARAFLDSFLRGDRDQKLRVNDASILQSLNLMNNSFVMGRIHKGNAGSLVARLLADTTLTNEQIITKLYLATLSRRPAADEVAKLLPYFGTTAATKQSGAESLQWVLLNKVDFVFNY